MNVRPTPTKADAFSLGMKEALQMEGIQIGAAVGLTFSVLYLFTIIKRLVKVGLTEYSGCGEMLKRCLVPMTSTTGICLLSASFIAYPLWANSAVSDMMTQVPSDMVPMIQMFSPLVIFLAGIAYILRLLRN